MYFVRSFFCLVLWALFSFFFFFNDTATTEIYTLSLHDALPIYSVYLDASVIHASFNDGTETAHLQVVIGPSLGGERSEEHTSELQSRLHLVCRLLLEKKKKKKRISSTALYVY